MRSSPRYLIAFFVLLAIEVAIALTLHDRFVRPYLGDSLAVVLLYCLLLSVLELPKPAAALSVFAFACCLEFAQYFQLVARLGLEQNELLRVMIGTVFSPLDLLAYAGGLVLIALLERALPAPR